MLTEKLQSVVCIIGAGPAGSSTSIFLSKLGIHHIIIDVASFPRNKVCGDGLDMKSIRMLNQIDPSIFQNEILKDPSFTACNGVRLIHPSGKNRDYVIDRKLAKPHYHPFYVSKRMDFDHFLVKKIDKTFANLLTETKAKSIEKTTDGWKIIAENNNGELEINCKLLVGADGDHSLLLRHLGERKIDRKHYAGSVRQYFKGVGDMHPDNLLEFYFPKKYPFSYFWIFPLPNGEANVGYIMVSKYASEKNYNIRKIFAELITTDPILKQRFANATPTGEEEGWGLPLSSLQRKAYGDGWLLVGDAASVVSPSNGEGIGNAMMSGYIAAEFIAKAIKLDNFEEGTFKNYQRELYRPLKEEIDRYNKYIDKKPEWSNWLINNLIMDNFVTQKLYKKFMQKWMETAYEKRIKVIVD